jgi:hypothetical protein
MTSPEATEHNGGCFCGAVRYRASAPPLVVAHCHCTMCRRISGAPLVTWAVFATDAFAFTQGTPAELRSSPQAVRTYCARCGTPLTFVGNERPQMIDVTVGSMDRPEDFAPAVHVWTSSRIPWLRCDDGLPRYRTAFGEDPEP